MNQSLILIDVSASSLFDAIHIDAASTIAAPKTNSITNTETNKHNSIKNIETINNKELKLDINFTQERESPQSLAPNHLNEKKITKNSNEEGKTVIMAKESGALLPSTLNNIFDENKAQELKEQMKKSKKREVFKKLLSFWKKVAELFNNEKYSVILVEKKDELIELSNNNFISSNMLIKDNEKFNDFISLCKNNLFFEKIPEISFEDSINHFDNNNLTKEGVISFCFESIYQNINTITNMEYSKNKDYQEKTIKFLSKLKDKKNSSINISIENNKNSFSNSFSDKKSISLCSISEKIHNISHRMSSQKIDLLKLLSDSNIKEC